MGSPEWGHGGAQRPGRGTAGSQGGPGREWAAGVKVWKGGAGRGAEFKEPGEQRLKDPGDLNPSGRGGEKGGAPHTLEGCREVGAPHTPRPWPFPRGTHTSPRYFKDQLF